MPFEHYREERILRDTLIDILGHKDFAITYGLKGKNLKVILTGVSCTPEGQYEFESAIKSLKGYNISKGPTSVSYIVTPSKKSY